MGLNCTAGSTAHYQHLCPIFVTNSMLVFVCLPVCLSYCLPLTHSLTRLLTHSFTHSLLIHTHTHTHTCAHIYTHMHACGMHSYTQYFTYSPLDMGYMTFQMTKGQNNRSRLAMDMVQLHGNL